MYHPGGISYDGKSIWLSVAEYRPNSKSIIYKINPKTMNAKEAFRTNDHIGGIFHDEKQHTLKAVSWGSRTFYAFNEKGKILSKSNNPSHFIDYQDCETAGKENLICSGITELPQQGAVTGKYELGGDGLIRFEINGYGSRIANYYDFTTRTRGNTKPCIFRKYRSRGKDVRHTR